MPVCWTNYNKGHSRRNHSYLFQTVVSNHCRCTPRGVRGIKRPEILWEIKKYSLPGRPSSHNWVKSITIEKCIKIPYGMANCFWFYSMMGEWWTWQWIVLDFSNIFWSFDTPETPGSVSVVFAENEIWNRLKQFLPVWDKVIWQVLQNFRLKKKEKLVIKVCFCTFWAVACIDGNSLKYSSW